MAYRPKAEHIHFNVSLRYLQSQRVTATVVNVSGPMDLGFPDAYQKRIRA